MSHTPGPYKAEIMPYKQCVYGPKGIIAEVIQNDLSEQEVVDNTYLLAAAPDMLEALKANVLIMLGILLS